MNNGDQSFGYGEGGKLRLDQATGYHYGDAYGVYRGSAGRFVNADDECYSEFTGQNVEPFTESGSRSIQGTVKGRLTK